MNIMRKYLLSSVYRSQDDPVADPVEPVAVDPALTADPVVDPAVIDPEPVPAPKAETTPKWALERIGEETGKRQAAEERERVATERANALEEITRRLQAGAKPGDTPAPQPVPEPANRRAAAASDVEQEAARLVFDRDVQRISETGLRQFGPKWADAVNILDRCNANSSEFVASVMEIDPAKTHEIMFQIAQDPEKAVALTRMSPARRIAEITRIADAMADSKAVVDPKPVAAADPKPAISRAPAPKPAVAPLAAAPDVNPMTAEGNDKLSDQEFERWYKDKYMKRSA